jgi:hypothetical protein
MQDTLKNARLKGGDKGTFAISTAAVGPPEDVGLRPEPAPNFEPGGRSPRGALWKPAKPHAGTAD